MQRTAASKGVTFPKSIGVGGGGGAAGEKCSRYHQNSDGNGFLFKFDPSDFQHWGLNPIIGGCLSPALGGGGGAPRDIKLRREMERLASNGSLLNGN